MYKFLPPLQWFHVTRALGVGLILYGLLVDHSPERSTIILSGLGLAGYDTVKRSEPSEKLDSSKDKE